MSNPAAGSSWNGWGAGVANARYQPADRGGLTAADVPRLKLKWAFGFPGVLAARAQPAVAGGRLFVASENGAVYALDAKTGCTYWTFRAQAGVRTAATVGPYKSPSGSTRYAVYFGDGRANAYAVDAETGQQVWVRKIDDHPGAVVTGAPTLYEGRLYVPAAGIGEEGQGGGPTYECCTFRGSLSALDASTGAVVWKTYSITEEPKPRGKNKDGVQTWGPAGGGIWAAPTVDPKRRAIYIATGNGYADPPQRTTDAVIALDLRTGKTRWVNQVTPGDVWMMGCKPENPDNPKCPAKMGPDYDFSASPLLTRSPKGRDLLVLPQKSGMAYALDPDKDGALVWQYRIGQGSGLGGQWGAAADGRQAYFGVSDFLSQNPGGMHAVSLDTGERVWYTPPLPKLCGTLQQCNAAQGGAVTVIPGAVLSSSADGGLRAYSTKDGSDRLAVRYEPALRDGQRRQGQRRHDGRPRPSRRGRNGVRELRVRRVRGTSRKRAARLRRGLSGSESWVLSHEFQNYRTQNSEPYFSLGQPSGGIQGPAFGPTSSGRPGGSTLSALALTYA